MFKHGTRRLSAVQRTDKEVNILHPSRIPVQPLAASLNQGPAGKDRMHAPHTMARVTGEIQDIPALHTHTHTHTAAQHSHLQGCTVVSSRSASEPTHSETPPKPDLLKKLNSQDAQALKNKLEPLNTWCAEHLSLLPNMSPDTVIQYTDTLIHQLTSAYYSFTNPSPHKPSKLEHTFAQLVNSLPPPR